MRRVKIVLVLLVVVLLVANIWHFLVRGWESSFYPVSYATLYYPADIPAILEWKQNSLRELELKIKWEKNVDGWRVLCDGKNSQTYPGMNPLIKIPDDELKYFTYTLTPLPEGIGLDFQVKLRFITKEYYSQRGLTHLDLYNIHPTIPVGDFQQYPVSYWVDDYDYVGETDLAEVERIICEEAKIDPSDATFTKMEKLVRYLRNQLKNAGGVPKDDFRWMNPYRIYKEMVNGTGKGWCTQNAQIWTFFANRAGIPTRLLLGSRTQDNRFLYNGHTWAESYIQEQNRWAFVDLAHSQIYVTNKKGQVLNSVDLLSLNQNDAFDSVSVRIYKDREWANIPGDAGVDSIVTVPYNHCKRTLQNEFLALSIFKYRRPPNVEDVRMIYSDFFKDATYCRGNLERYLFKPPLAYSFYPTDGKRTYWMRWSLFYGLLGALIGLIGVVVVGKLRR